MLVIKNMLILMVCIVILDMIWLGYLAKPLYIKSLGSFMHFKDGEMEINYVAAALVYVCLSLGIILFVMPLAEGVPLKAMMWGAIFGFLVYAIYDLTNLAIVHKWPLFISIIDMIWGGVLCGTCSYVLALFNKYY
jgi:uncharacterized membrane protein